MSGSGFAARSMNLYHVGGKYATTVSCVIGDEYEDNYGGPSVLTGRTVEVDLV